MSSQIGLSLSRCILFKHLQARKTSDAWGQVNNTPTTLLLPTWWQWLSGEAFGYYLERKEIDTEQLRNSLIVCFNLQNCFMRATPPSLLPTLLPSFSLNKNDTTTIVFLLLYNLFQFLNYYPHIKIPKARNVKVNFYFCLIPHDQLVTIGHFSAKYFLKCLPF